MTASGTRADDELSVELGRLKAFASSLGGDSEDLVQEALARAIANGIPVEAGPWLRTVMRRLAIDRSRRAREVASGDSFDMDGLAADPNGDPQDVVLSDERVLAVRRALAELPPRYRDALVSYATDGCASSVARRLSLSPQATWTLLHRARTRLRAELERVGFAPAALASRFSPWWSSATTSAAAVCCVLALGAGPATVAPQTPAPRPSVDVAAAAVGTPMDVAHEAPVATPAPTPSRSRLEQPRAVVRPEVQTPIRYRAEACAPNDAAPVRVGGEMFYRDDPSRATLSDQVAGALPAEMRKLIVHQECR